MYPTGTHHALSCDECMWKLHFLQYPYYMVRNIHYLSSDGRRPHLSSDRSSGLRDHHLYVVEIDQGQNQNTWPVQGSGGRCDPLFFDSVHLAPYSGGNSSIRKCEDGFTFYVVAC